eukprot:11185484-Alexandrium_andersonii.AAC.1
MAAVRGTSCRAKRCKLQRKLRGQSRYRSICQATGRREDHPLALPAQPAVKLALHTTAACTA